MCESTIEFLKNPVGKDGCLRIPGKKLSVELLKGMGFEAREVRGRPVISHTYVDVVIDGFPVSFTRRRYGQTTFCWVHFYHQGEWVWIGDPWQAVTPKFTEIAQAIRTTIAGPR
ncbi:MAG: hypothetical protein K2P78_04545 [Gemmataceae bacterium]|nr:hypothetical protein [Gemmataceae bacterium]